MEAKREREGMEAKRGRGRRDRQTERQTGVREDK